MKNVRLKETDYFVAWILFFLVSTIAGAVVGAIFGGIIGFILGAAGVSLESIAVAGGIVGFIMGLPISYITFRLVVSKFIVGKITK